MFKLELTCNCGSSLKFKMSPEEYKDFSYALRMQTDRWLEAHGNHDPYTPAIAYPVSPTVEASSGMPEVDEERERAKRQMSSILDSK